MISVIASLLYLSLLLMVGCFLLCVTSPGRRWPVGLAVPLCFGLGAGGLSSVLFWLSLLGSPPNRIALLGLGVFTILVILFLYSGGQRPVEVDSAIQTMRGSVPVERGLMILVAIFTTWIIAASIAFSLYDWDGLAIWGFKAKVVLQEAVGKTSYFQTLSKGFSHLDYPLLQPFLVAGHYAALGGVDDQWGKLTVALFYPALLLLLFGELRRWLSLKQALILIALYAALPGLMKEATGGAADVTLTFFYAGSVIFLARWLELRRAQDLVLCCLYTYFCLFTKNEGLALAAINVVLVIGYGLRHKGLGYLADVGAYAIILLALSSPWLIFRETLPKVHADYWGQLSLGVLKENWGRASGIASTLGGQIFDLDSWSGLWITLLVVSFIGWRGWLSSRVRILWLLLCSHLSLYWLAFLISPVWERGALLEVTERLVLHTTPVCLLLIGLHWEASSARAPFNGDQVPRQET